MKMPVLFRHGLLFLLSCAGGLSAGTVQQPRLVDRVDPVFPQGLLLQGITRGAVRCVIDVDVAGKVEDVLVIAHTDPAFARSVREAVLLWRFEPAQVDGRTVPAQSTLEFTIEAVGVVTTLDLMTYVNRQFKTIWGEAYEYRPHPLKELDAIPVPRRTVKPGYPAALAAQQVKGQVRVDFYIDEEGRVRVPIVSHSEHPQLASAAVDAVRQWQFEPPLRNGRRVLVFASQDFNFNAVP